MQGEKEKILSPFIALNLWPAKWPTLISSQELVGKGSREEACSCSVTEHRTWKANLRSYGRTPTGPPTNIGISFVYLRLSHESELRNKKLFRLFRSCRQANYLLSGGVFPTVHHTDSRSMAVHISHSFTNLLIWSSILLLVPNAMCFVSFLFILMWTESPHASRQLDYHRPL